VPSPERRLLLRQCRVKLWDFLVQDVRSAEAQVDLQSAWTHLGEENLLKVKMLMLSQEIPKTQTAGAREARGKDSSAAPIPVPSVCPALQAAPTSRCGWGFTPDRQDLLP